MHGRVAHYSLLCTAAGCLFLVNLGGASLWDVDEGRNATAAYEMLESGNWIVPTFNSELRADKPALLYWLQMMAYGVFGVNEFAARLPSALAALIAVLLCYELGRSLFSVSTGLIAGLIAASTPMLSGAARFANPDSLLNVCTVATFYVFWIGYARGRLCFILLGIVTGLGMLAKGPVGLALPALATLLFLLWNGQLRLAFDRRMGLGVFWFLLVALPWYLWVAADTKAAFLRGFFLQHNVSRFLNPMESHDGIPLIYYLGVLLVGMAPWSVFLALATWYGGWSVVRRPWGTLQKYHAGAVDREGFRHAGAEASESAHLPYRFLVCWIVVFLGFYSVSATKLPNYILPVVVPCALLTGRFLDRWRRGILQAPAWTIHAGLAFLVLVGVIAVAGVTIASGRVPLAALRGRIFPSLEAWAACGLVPVAGAGLAWWFWKRRLRTGAVASVIMGSMLFVGPLAAWASAVLNGFKAPRPLVEAAGALQRGQDIRVGCWEFGHLPSLHFYCQRDVDYLNREEDVVTFLQTPVLQVFLFASAGDWEDFARKNPGPYRVIARHPDLYRGCDAVVVTNR